MKLAMANAHEYITSIDARLKTADIDLDVATRKVKNYKEKQTALSQLLTDAQIRCNELVAEAEERRNSIIQRTETECKELVAQAHIVAARLISDSKLDAEDIQTNLHDRISTIADTVTAIRGMVSQIEDCCDATAQMIAEPDAFFYDIEAEPISEDDINNVDADSNVYDNDEYNQEFSNDYDKALAESYHEPMDQDSIDDDCDNNEDNIEDVSFDDQSIEEYLEKQISSQL